MATKQPAFRRHPTGKQLSSHAFQVGTDAAGAGRSSVTAEPPADGKFIGIDPELDRELSILLGDDEDDAFSAPRQKKAVSTAEADGREPYRKLFLTQHGGFHYHVHPNRPRAPSRYMSFMQPRAPPDEVESQLRQTAMDIVAADTNQDGLIDFDEFKALVHASMPSQPPRSDAQLRAWYDELDTDHDGALRMAEFFAFALRESFLSMTAGPDGPHSLEAYIKRWDKNGDGQLDRREFTKLCDRIGFGGLAKALMVELDTDESGKISTTELVQMLKKAPRSSGLFAASAAEQSKAAAARAAAREAREAAIARGSRPASPEGALDAEPMLLSKPPLKLTGVGAYAFESWFHAHAARHRAGRSAPSSPKREAASEASASGAVAAGTGTAAGSDGGNDGGGDGGSDADLGGATDDGEGGGAAATGHGASGAPAALAAAPPLSAAPPLFADDALEMELLAALVANGPRLLECFHSWGLGLSDIVSVVELRRALAVLGVPEVPSPVIARDLH